jgi:quinol monooxygenase YgiN
MSPSPIRVLVRYRALPGKSEATRRELESLIARVLDERGCLGIAMYEAHDDPESILLEELWSDAATYLGPHRETPHLTAFITRAQSLLAGPPEITLWRPMETGTR